MIITQNNGCTYHLPTQSSRTYGHMGMRAWWCGYGAEPTRVPGSFGSAAMPAFTSCGSVLSCSSNSTRFFTSLHAALRNQISLITSSSLFNKSKLHHNFFHLVENLRLFINFWFFLFNTRSIG